MASSPDATDIPSHPGGHMGRARSRRALRGTIAGGGGFVHCTDGADALVATANRHCRGDPRAYLALTIDLDAAGSPWRIEDPAGLYPHVYGPIAPEAIVAVTEMRRAPDGRFTTLADGA
jgi:uncharacterized protein (DUF952 family)